MSKYISRREYANTFGPTVGDLIRLADTDLFIEVEMVAGYLPASQKSNQQ